MSHGKRAAQKSNRRVEYWSRRPGNLGGATRGRETKTHTHRIERRRAQREMRRELIEATSEPDEPTPTYDKALDDEDAWTDYLVQRHDAEAYDFWDMYDDFEEDYSWRTDADS